MSMFGDFAEDIPDSIKPKTTFFFELKKVETRQNVNEDDPKRCALILSWEIIHDGNDDHADYIGMQPSNSWITYWNGLEREDFDAFDDKTKKSWKMSKQNFNAIVRALGYSEEEIAANIDPTDLHDKVGSAIAAKCYNRNGQDQLETSSIASIESKVEA